MVVALVSVTGAGAAVGSAVVARHRAQAAADLAALGAAVWLPSGRERACTTAGSIAAAMAGQVAGCDIEGTDVVVRVEVAARLGRWGAGRASAIARAGPGADTS